MNKLMERIEAVRNDDTHGASELARHSLEILRDAAGATTPASTAAFLEEMQAIAWRLAGSRPAMAAIRNCTRRFMNRLMECSRAVDSVEEIKTLSVRVANDLISSIDTGRNQAIVNGASLVTDGTCIVSCSYSSMVIQTFKLAAEQGKHFKVLILESISGKLVYGKMMAARLTKACIHNSVVPDESFRNDLSKADFVLLGADTVLLNGSLINGYPSLNLAKAAAENTPPLPVYSICESTKFNLDINLTHNEKGFDLVPADLIKAIITEDGIVKPAEVSRYAQDLIKSSCW